MCSGYLGGHLDGRALPEGVEHDGGPVLFDGSGDTCGRWKSPPTARQVESSGMDQLRAKIIDALERTGYGKVDPTKFELCAAELLKVHYPRLVPVVGGSDHGCDGVIWTPDGPYPLITTTGKNAIENFTRNVRAFLAEYPDAPRQAVFATSQSLTEEKQGNIRKRAKELEVTLVGLYEQAEMAYLLYRHPSWRRELLGITGHPPALSSYPLRRRFSSPEVMVGRDADLTWLRETAGDLLLVGEPGSGKTFLHERLASEDGCLFAVDFELGRLHDDVVGMQPRIIVIDDAHVNPDHLATVLRLKSLTAVPFSIHANCWPQFREEVRGQLDVTSSSVRELPLMSRVQLAELIKRLGIAGPEPLVGLLLDACENRPGLAAAFVRVCLRDGPDRVWTGEAIAQHFLHDSRFQIETTAQAALGVIALGGDAGMGLAEVAAALGIKWTDALAAVTNLTVGGLVADAGSDRLQVRPRLLRPAVLRRTFFNKGLSLSVDESLRLIPSAGSTAHELIRCRQRGAAVDVALLGQLAERSGRDDVWQHLAAADEACARLILSRYPEQIPVAAAGLLLHSAYDSLPLLLAADVTVGPHKSEARRNIVEWLSPAWVGAGTPVERRRLLVNALDKLNGEIGAAADATVAWGLAEVLDIGYSHHRPSVVDRYAGAIESGVLKVEDVRAVAALWPRVCAVFNRLTGPQRPPVLAAVETWCISRRLTTRLKSPDAYDEIMSETGRGMLVDLTANPDTPRFVRSWAAGVNVTGRLGLRIRTVKLFDALFSRQRVWGERRINAEERRKARLQRLARLVAKWPPKKAAAELASIVREAVAAGETSSSYDRGTFAGLVAAACKDPAVWWPSLAAEELPPELVFPFVERVADADRVAYEASLADLLDRPAYGQEAARCVLRLNSPPAGLLDTAIAVVERPEKDGDYSLPVYNMPVATVARLLRHENAKVRSMAAVGEWWREHPASVRRELLDDWRVAVLDVDATNPLLEGIFPLHPELAVGWCRAHLQKAESEHAVERVGRGVSAALPALTFDNRRELLRLVVGPRYSNILLDMLIGDDMRLFAGWLNHHPDATQKPRLLRQEWSPRWERLVFAALDAGCTPQTVADYSIPHSFAFGPFYPGGRYRDYLAAYQRLLANPDNRVHLTAKAGIEWAEDCIRRVEEHTRQRELQKD